MDAALNYREPDIVSILILSSFLLVLNVGDHIVNSYLSCGLVAQILIGIAWGTSGAKLLNQDAENFITLLGYLGLIFLVFEGGLSTNVQALRKNLILSCVVAFTGISIPIALSFILIRLADATPLQSFAAGAALCSTSLGTTFTVLKTSGFAQTRLGSVLMSAAMLDDVVGLVMIQVISNLNGAFEPASIMRPVGVSIAFALISACFCSSMKYCAESMTRAPIAGRIIGCRHSAFVAQTLFLIGMVTAASYAGTSNLFATYLAGICVSWWYENDDVQKSTRDTRTGRVQNSAEDAAIPDSSAPIAAIQPTEKSIESCPDERDGAILMYKRYYLPIAEGIMKPFFFASIGFAIPIKQMFESGIIWRGFVYASLMIIAKMLTGLWLIQFDLSMLFRLKRTIYYIRRYSRHLLNKNERTVQPSIELSCSATRSEPAMEKSTDQMLSENAKTAKEIQPRTKKPCEDSPKQATSLYPVVILGTAMVARGEIGFLIATTARSNGIFAQASSQSLYLIIIWAVVLCTVVGPVFTGLLVKRVKSLQQVERSAAVNEREDPLGPWGLL